MKIFLTVLFSMLIAGLSALADQQIDIQKVMLDSWTLSGNANAIAVQPETGVTVISIPSKKKLYLYRDIVKSIEPDIQLDVDGATSSICWTRIDNKPVLLLNTQSSTNITLLDENLKQLGIITLANMPIGPIAASDAELPYAFYTSAGKVYNRSLNFIDLKGRKDLGPVDLELNARFDSDRLKLSPDGQVLYSHRTHSSPSGIYAWNIVERAGRIKIESLYDEHDSAVGYVNDSRSRYVANTTGVWLKDMSSQLAKVSGMPIGFVDNKPYFLTRRELYDSKLKIDVISINSGSVVRRYDINPAEGNTGDNQECSLAINNPKRCLIWVNGIAKMTIVPFEKLGDFDEPDLALKESSVIKSELGKPINVPIKPSTEGVNVKLESGPDGLTYENGVIHWPPEKQQIGMYYVRLQLSKASSQRVEQVQLEVRRSAIELPMRTYAQRISPDGKKLFLMDQTYDQSRNSGQKRPTVMLVVDLAKGKIIARQETKDVLTSSVAINNDFVLVLDPTTQQAKLLRLDDLSFVAAFSGEGNLNAVGITNEAAVLYIQKGMQLKSVAYRLSDHTLFPDFPSGAPILQTPLGLWAGRTLVDPKSLKPIMVSDIDGVPVFRTGGTEQRNFMSLSRFGDPRRLSENTSPFGQPSKAQFLNNAPVMIKIDLFQEANRGDDDSARRIRRTNSFLKLTLSSADGSDFQRAITVCALPKSYHGWEYYCGLQIDETEKSTRAIVTSFDQVYVIELDSLIKELNVTPPPYVASVKPLVNIAATGKSTVSAAFAGGTTPIRYGLSRPIEDVAINTETGEITIDADKLSVRAAEQLGGTLTPGVSSMDAFSEARSRFNQLTGKDPAGVPIAIAVDLSAVDTKGRKAVLNRIVLMDIPANLIKSRNLPEQVGGDGINQRILQLEKENAGLKAQNELLREMLNQRGASPATHPASTR